MNWMKTHMSRLLLGGGALILLLILGRAAFLFFKYDLSVIAFPYPVDYGEGPILDQVMHMAKFQNIYRPNPTEIPFTISNYPPGFHIVQLPFAWIFGPELWYGRLLSMLSILATVIFITLTLRILTQDWLASIFGGLTLLSLPYILQWSGYCRVDSFALGLSWAGLYFIARWPYERRGLISSSLFLTAAIFTRQSYGLAAPFAAFIWLISQKPRSQAFKLAFWVGGFSLVLLILANILTRGAFFFNIVTANVNQFFWNTVKDYFSKMWNHMPYFILSSLAFLFVAVWFRVKSWWMVAPYLLASAASAVTVGKDGSSVNYMYEISAAFSLAAGAILAVPGKRQWVRLILMFLLAAQVFFIYDWTKNDYFNWVYTRVTNERHDIAQLQEMVRLSDAPVLADEFMGLVPLAGKELPFQPFEFKQLVIARVWDQKPFLKSLRQDTYGLILLYDPPNWDSRGARWTKEQLEAINLNYERVGRFANTIVYKPYQSLK